MAKGTVHAAGKRKSFEEKVLKPANTIPDITRPEMPLVKPIDELNHKFTFPSIRDSAGQEKYPELVIWRKTTRGKDNTATTTIQVRVPQPKGKSYEEQLNSGTWENAGASHLEHHNLFVTIDVKNPRKAQYAPVYTSSGGGPHELNAKQAAPHLKELKRLVDIHERTIDDKLKPRDAEMIRAALSAIKEHLKTVI